MFLMNKYSAAERIRRALPYIETVQFRRSLPDGLSIIVTECADPAAIVQDGKRTCCATREHRGRGSARCREAADAGKGPDADRPGGRSAGKGGGGAGAGTGAAADADAGAGPARHDGGRIAAGYERPGTADAAVSGTVRRAAAREADYGYKLDYLMAVVEKLEVNEKGVINMMQEGKARFIPE